MLHVLVTIFNESSLRPSWNQPNEQIYRHYGDYNLTGVFLITLILWISLI